MSIGKVIGIIVLAIIGSIVALNIVGWLFKVAIAAIFHLIVPLAVVGGVLYIIYRVTDKKAIGSGKRSSLP